jgi:hypothetical protein
MMHLCARQITIWWKPAPYRKTTDAELTPNTDLTFKHTFDSMCKKNQTKLIPNASTII